MSNTSLWIIDTNWTGKEYKRYQNSWLFPPTVYDTLLCQYISTSERDTSSYFSWLGYFKPSQEKADLLNGRINNSKVQYDRVLWELSNLSVFNAKDKEFVADCIEKFADAYLAKTTDNDAVKPRFLEIANDIRHLPKRCKYFVIHPTDCDDNVERWFYRKRLSSWNEFVCEFTLIENNRIIGFSDNVKMCKKEI